MLPRRGYVLTAGLAALALGAAAAPAQTPAETEALSITLTVSPRVQTATFDEVVTLRGEVTGGELLEDALADRSLELEVDATALGYDRPLQIDPIVPRRDGSFARRLDVSTNAAITVRPPDGGTFTGASPTVTTHWRPMPEISNYPRGKRLVMEYRVSVPGGIPFERGSLKVRRGSATRAVFYAGPRRSIPRIGSARLRSAYDGEVHARLVIPFKDLPPGGGRIYACAPGTAFLGTDPVDPRCGAQRTTRKIPPLED